MPAVMGQALEQLAQQAPDLIVVTGDLLDYPSDALSDPEMLALGEQDLLMLRGMLDDTGLPYVVVYGNHDHAGSVRRVFGRQPCDLVCAGYRVICFHDDDDREHVPHRVGEERERFVAALSDASSLPQIHVQHYLPWPTGDLGYPYCYPDAEAMQEAIVGSGLVRLVLCGHYHEGMPPFQQGQTWFAAAPALAEAPHAYWLYTFDQDTFVWQERKEAE
jgi:Icc protein